MAAVLVACISISVSAQEPDRPVRESSCHFAARTNLLYDLAAVPNVGIAVQWNHRWSLSVDWMYAWWRSDAHNFSWQTWGGYLSARRYFGRKSYENAFAGHHIGAYAMVLTYDVELGGRGYQAASPGFGGGFEYGYCIPLTGNLGLDLSLGLGYLGGQYKVYDPQDGHFVWQETRQRHWIGPTRAEVSLVWTLGSGSRTNRKGGGR